MPESTLDNRANLLSVRLPSEGLEQSPLEESLVPSGGAKGASLVEDARRTAVAGEAVDELVRPLAAQQDDGLSHLVSDVRRAIDLSTDVQALPESAQVLGMLSQVEGWLAYPAQKRPPLSAVVKDLATIVQFSKSVVLKENPLPELERDLFTRVMDLLAELVMRLTSQPEALVSGPLASAIEQEVVVAHGNSAPPSVGAEQRASRSVKVFRIRGKVISKRGRIPIPGVRVNGGALGVILTDRNGEFLFANVAQGTKYALTIEKRGFVFDPPYVEDTLLMSVEHLFTAESAA